MKKTLLNCATVLAFITAAQAEVKVGAALPVTGPIASATPPVEKSLTLAVKQINEQGGMFKTGEKLEMIVGDSACDPVAAVDAVKKLVDVNQVVAFVGPMCSGATIAQAQSVSIPAGVVSVAISATSPAISTLEKGTDLLFRAVASDAYQGVAMADLALQKGMKDIAVMYSNDDYNIGLSKVFIESYKAKGGKITAVQSFDPGKTSYRGEVTTLGKDTKNLAFFAYPGNGGVILIRNALESGAFTNFLGADSMRTDDLIKQIGVANLKNLTLIAPMADENSEPYKLWVKSVNEAGFSPTDAFVTNAYDAMFVLALAIEKVGSTDRTKVNAALRAVANGPGEAIYPGEFAKAKKLIAEGKAIRYMGASGDMDFDENGDVKGLYGANNVSADGKWIPVLLK